MNLSEGTASIYLASNDYKVGTIFPLREILRVEMGDVPTPGKPTKQSKMVLWLRDAPKGFIANKQCLRKIGAALGCTSNIDKGWLGALVSVEVVGDVRRPDGTRGNAFRVREIKPAAPAPVPATNQGA